VAGEQSAVHSTSKERNGSTVGWPGNAVQECARHESEPAAARGVSSNVEAAAAEVPLLVDRALPVDSHSHLAAVAEQELH